jgi:hypothetical protein
MAMMTAVATVAAVAGDGLAHLAAQGDRHQGKDRHNSKG